MTDLWNLFRSTWPGILAEKMPSGLSLTKVIIPRAEYFEPDPAQWLIVLIGEVTERLSSYTGKEAIVRVYESREIILARAGFLYTEEKTHLLQLGQGWDMVLPEVHALVQMHTAAEMLEIKRRFAAAQVDTVLERVAAYVQEHGVDPATVCRAEVGRRVGCSRRSASAALQQLMEAA